MYIVFKKNIILHITVTRHFCRYKPSPCNNGTCIETNNNDGYSCTCVVGFTGDKCDQQGKIRGTTCTIS